MQAGEERERSAEEILYGLPLRWRSPYFRRGHIWRLDMSKIVAFLKNERRDYARQQADHDVQLGRRGSERLVRFTRALKEAAGHGGFLLLRAPARV
jgi:hypothetical protein